jgi:hypothetical protein
MPSKQNFHGQFDKFVTQFGGRLIRDMIGSKSPSFDNADYLFEGVIAELKVIETNRDGDEAIQAKLQARFDEWLQSGKLSDIAYGKPVIQSDQLPNELQWELQRIHSEPIRRLIQKANKQIRLTKENLQLTDAKGLLLLLNQKDYSQAPEYLAYAVHQSLIVDFSSIQNVTVFTSNLTVTSSQVPARSRPWLDYIRDKNNTIDLRFLNRLRDGWAKYLSNLLGVPLPVIAIASPVDLSKLRYD